MSFLIIAAFITGLLVKHFYKDYTYIQKIVNKYIMYIGLPLIVLVALTGSKQLGIEKVILISILFNIAAILIFFRLFKSMDIKNRTKASLFLCTAFGNIAYLGIPYSLMFFGNDGAAVCAIFTIITALFHFSFGVALSNSYIKKRDMPLKDLVNPLSIGIIIAFLISRLDITIPLMIENIAHLGTYMILFVIGMTTTITRPTKDYLAGIGGKFIISPIIMIILLFITGSMETQYYPFMLLAIMPPAFVNTVLSVNYGFDKEYTSKFTSITTIIMIAIFTAASIIL
ncbi:MAG: AEC family transporter [Candidatus Aenigmarchaeota archaeon]|nr:AEC family transporter [Candidatus Aenigmarchaeota archaeon]